MRSLGQRGIIVNWLVKIVVGIALVGIIAFDAGSIAVNFFGLDSIADDTALAVATDVQSGVIPANNTVLMKRRAVEVAREQNARVADVTITPEGVVQVTLRRKADTILVSRIGPIEDWARATAEGSSGTK